jgi:hypothetical protein
MVLKAKLIQDGIRLSCQAYWLPTNSYQSLLDGLSKKLQQIARRFVMPARTRDSLPAPELLIAVRLKSWTITVCLPVCLSVCLLASSFHSGILLGMFHPEDGGDVFFRNVGWLSTDHSCGNVSSYHLIVSLQSSNSLFRIRAAHGGEGSGGGLLESDRWTPSFQRSILPLSSRKLGVNMMSWLRRPQFESTVNLHECQLTRIIWSVLNLRSSLYRYTPQCSHSFTAVKCNYEC